MATLKQKRAIKKIMENSGKSISGAMREAGYSPKSAKTPKVLTTSKAWRELLNEYLPDDLLLSALKEDIKAKKQNRKAELELGFKLKGKLVEKQELAGTLKVKQITGMKIKKIDGADISY